MTRARQLIDRGNGHRAPRRFQPGNAPPDVIARRWLISGLFVTLMGVATLVMNAYGLATGRLQDDWIFDKFARMLLTYTICLIAWLALRRRARQQPASGFAIAALVGIGLSFALVFELVEPALGIVETRGDALEDLIAGLLGSVDAALFAWVDLRLRLLQRPTGDR